MSSHRREGGEPTGRGMVKEATSGSMSADVMARRWEERVRVLASVNGRPVDVHGWCFSTKAPSTAASYGTDCGSVTFVLVKNVDTGLYVRPPSVCSGPPKSTLNLAPRMLIVPQLYLYDAQRSRCTSPNNIGSGNLIYRRSARIVSHYPHRSPQQNTYAYTHSAEMPFLVATLHSGLG